MTEPPRSLEVDAAPIAEVTTDLPRWWAFLATFEQSRKLIPVGQVNPFEGILVSNLDTLAGSIGIGVRRSPVTGSEQNAGERMFAALFEDLGECDEPTPDEVSTRHETESNRNRLLLHLNVLRWDPEHSNLAEIKAALLCYEESREQYRMARLVPSAAPVFTELSQRVASMRQELLSHDPRSRWTDPPLLDVISRGTESLQTLRSELEQQFQALPSDMRRIHRAEYKEIVQGLDTLRDEFKATSQQRALNQSYHIIGQVLIPRDKMDASIMGGMPETGLKAYAQSVAACMTDDRVGVILDSLEFAHSLALSLRRLSTCHDVGEQQRGIEALSASVLDRVGQLAPGRFVLVPLGGKFATYGNHQTALEISRLPSGKLCLSLINSGAGSELHPARIDGHRAQNRLTRALGQHSDPALRDLLRSGEFTSALARACAELDHARFNSSAAAVVRLISHLKRALLPTLSSHDGTSVQRFLAEEFKAGDCLQTEPYAVETRSPLVDESEMQQALARVCAAALQLRTQFLAVPADLRSGLHSAMLDGIEPFREEFAQLLQLSNVTLNRVHPEIRAQVLLLRAVHAEVFAGMEVGIGLDKVMAALLTIDATHGQITEFRRLLESLGGRQTQFSVDDPKRFGHPQLNGTCTYRCIDHWLRLRMPDLETYSAVKSDATATSIRMLEQLFDVNDPKTPMDFTAQEIRREAERISVRRERKHERLSHDLNGH